jgi:quercetin dioxygenase-like cupin family protein
MIGGVSMRLSVLVGAVVGFGVIVGGASAQYGTPVTPSAEAQDAKPAVEKGVKTKDLVTSLGGFRGTASIPVVLTGQIVEIEAGGQTGRQRFMVPSYIYVLEGTLITDTEGGPIGVSGVQYHAAGQSYMDPVGVWQTHKNAGTTPVKYLLLLINTPGGATTQKAGSDD